MNSLLCKNSGCKCVACFYTFVFMSLFIASLNSGSNGNCYYVGNKNEAILIDAGISCRTIEKRMKHLGLNLLSVKAVFISHEHSDHIQGLCTLLKKYKIPLFVSEKTFPYCGVEKSNVSITHFNDGEKIAVGKLNINVFSKTHDAVDPYSFCVESEGVHVGIFTDLGFCCDKLIHWFSKCHAAFLEANFDEAMLMDGPYPYYLKKRIAGGNGHLSNDQAYQLFTKHKSAYLSHLILSHLSHNNNSPEVVESLFSGKDNQVQIIVASRSAASDVFEISDQKLFIEEEPQSWVQSIIRFGGDS